MSTSLTVRQLAEHLSAELVGDPDGRVQKAAPLETAATGFHRDHQIDDIRRRAAVYGVVR